MVHRIVLLFAALAFAVPALSANSQCGPKRVALSFDDAPRPGTAVMSGWERTARIVAALDGSGVDEAAFFSLSERAVGEGRDRLLAYARAGHVIANHSASHPNLHRVGAAVFLQDVRAAHAVLSKLPGFQPLFRFPMLNEGRSIEERDAIRAGLAELGYRQGYVTIDTYDFYIDNYLRQSVAKGRQPDEAALGRLYVESILGAAEHYDAIACAWLGRSPAHVLLLHENDVAALYLGQLIAGLRANGWTIITATEAYADPMSRSTPDTLLLGQGRVAALAHIAGAAPSALRHESESTEYLDRKLQAVPATAREPDPEIAAIVAQSERFSRAYIDEDLESLIAIYTEDAVAGPPGRDFVLGRNALRRFWQVAEGTDVVAHRAVPERIVIEDGIAYDWGHYSGAIASNGETRPFEGKYLIVWRKGADGVWRMAHDMWS